MWKLQLATGQFISTEYALRLPTTYDNHTIQSNRIRPYIYKASAIIKSGLGLIWVDLNLI